MEILFKDPGLFCPGSHQAGIRSHDLHELDVEVELLSGHLVVGVQSDIGLVLGGHSDREGLAHHISEEDALTDVEVLGAGELGDLDREDLLGVGHAIGLLRHEVDVDSVADLHVSDRLVKAADHHARTADEVQGLAAVVGGVELGTVVEGSPVVDPAGLAGILALQDDPGSTAAAASAAAALFAFTAAAAFLSFAAAAAFLALTVVAAAAAFFPFAVVAALVALAVVMVVAVGTRGDKGARQIIGDRLVRIALGSGDDCDPSLLESVHGTAAKAAADQDIDRVVRQKSRKGTVANAVGPDHLTGDDLSVLDIIDLEILGPSEVLEDVSVLISSCNSHCGLSSSHKCIFMRPPDDECVPSHRHCPYAGHRSPVCLFRAQYSK